MSQTICKVCIHSGNKHQAHTHTTRGKSDPILEHVITCGGWKLTKPLGATTNCPVLRNNICTNPLCFNGMDGIVRFPEFGHTSKYCPCAWPDSEPVQQNWYWDSTIKEWVHSHHWYYDDYLQKWMNNILPQNFQNDVNLALILDDELCTEDIIDIIQISEFNEEQDYFTDIMDDWVERQELEECAEFYKNVHYIED